MNAAENFSIDSQAKTPIYSGLYKSIVQYIDVSDINSAVPPRIGAETLRRFCASLTSRGFLKPLFIDTSGRLEDGCKRYAAALCLGLKRAPYIVCPTPLIFQDDLIFRDLALPSLHFFDYAEKLKTLTDKYLYTQEYIALALDKSQSYIANKLRLLRFEAEEREKIWKAGLTERHCRSLLRLSSPGERAAALTKVIDGRLNVSATDEYVSRLLAGRVKDPIDEFGVDLEKLLDRYAESLSFDLERRSSGGRFASLILTAKSKRFT